MLLAVLVWLHTAAAANQGPCAFQRLEHLACVLPSYHNDCII
jgi:hypothetical protein